MSGNFIWYTIIVHIPHTPPLVGLKILFHFSESLIEYNVKMHYKNDIDLYPLINFKWKPKRKNKNGNSKQDFIAAGNVGNDNPTRAARFDIERRTHMGFTIFENVDQWHPKRRIRFVNFLIFPTNETMESKNSGRKKKDDGTRPLTFKSNMFVSVAVSNIFYSKSCIKM